MGNKAEYDIGGFDVLTEAIRKMLDQYPGLPNGEQFEFSSLPTGYGKAVFPTTGAVIQLQRESITGHVYQECQYPLTILYRASGMSQKNRVSAKEWLDTLGQWLEMQPVKINGKLYKLQNYPVLNDTREIRDIYRQTPAYLSQIGEDKSEDWLISVVVQYRNEFDK